MGNIANVVVEVERFNNTTPRHILSANISESFTARICWRTDMTEYLLDWTSCHAFVVKVNVFMIMVVVQLEHNVQAILHGAFQTSWGGEHVPTIAECFAD